MVAWLERQALDVLIREGDEAADLGGAAFAGVLLCYIIMPSASRSMPACHHARIPYQYVQPAVL